MTEAYLMTLADLDVILSGLSGKDLAKIPSRLQAFIHENRMPPERYTPAIRTDIPLENQTLREETSSMLALLYGCYWATDEADRESLIHQILRNSGGGSPDGLRESFDEILQLFPREDT